jgi:hypothetical protein
MTKDQEQKMLKYIDAFEEVNKQLVFALKHSVRLLSQLQPQGKTRKHGRRCLIALKTLQG